MRKKALRILFSAIFVLHLGIAFGDAIPGVPNPAERVLIIYTNCTGYNEQLMQAYRDALLAITPAPTVDLLLITCGNRNGFYDELVAQYGRTDLNLWCEVYDLRFRDDRNNLAFDGTIWEDVLTYIGPAGQTDWDLFENFLNQGGHLYLQGEHHDYYCRNVNLIMFINSVAATAIGQSRANVRNGAWTINQYSATPENFNSDFNTLSGNIFSNYPGGISLPQLGSARALITTDLGASGDPAAPGGMSAVVMGYLPADLRTNGRLVVGWETNAFTEGTLKNALSDAIIQNIYDFLSGCYDYTVEKTFIPDTLCVGESGTFTICYENTGMAVPSVSIWDTIPSYLTVNSFSAPPTGGPQAVSGGNLYWWTFSPLASGANACITVNFTVNSMP